MAKEMPPLKSLLTFSSVMETGSFARAAAQLNITPSAVSHQIRLLEDSLGKPLFIRANRSVEPTEDARTYATALAESFTRIAIATSRVADRSGVLRLVMHSAPSFAALWLVPRLKAFKRAHPEIDVTLFASHEPAKLGEDGFMLDIQYNRPVPEACDHVVLAEERVVAMASPAFVAEQRVEGLEALARVPLIHSVRCVVQWDEWMARHAPTVLMNPRGMRFDRASLALVAAADGLGILLESELQATDMLAAGRVVMPFGPVGVNFTAHRVVYRRDERSRPQIEAFVAWITATMAADRAAGARG